MRRSGKGSGGGLGSRNVVRKPQGKIEPRPHAMNVKGVGQIGTSLGNHVTRSGESLRTRDVREPLHGGRGYSTPVGISDPVKAVGVGGGRTVHHCGGQSQHGSANPGAPGLPSTKGQWPDGKR